MKLTSRSLPITIPLAVFVAANVGLLVLLLSHPTFKMIGRTYWFNTIGMSLVWTACALVALVRWLKGRGRAAAWIVCLFCAVVCFGVRIYATHIEPRCLAVRHVTIVTDKVDRPVRILHFSDVQSDQIGAYEEKAFAMMRSLEPDLVLATGDLLQPQPPVTFYDEIPKLAELLGSLAPPLGKYGVAGDTDGPIGRLGPDRLGGLTILRSSGARIDVEGASIRVLGLSRGQANRAVDPRPAVEQWLSEGDEGDVTLVMGHAPDYVLDILDLPVDLCLAGHTHGGQIRIPFFGPLLTLSEVPRAWARGFRDVGDTRLNVSAGVGCEHLDGLPSIRVFCRPEMTLIELVPGERSL